MKNLLYEVKNMKKNQVDSSMIKEQYFSAVAEKQRLA